MQGVPAIGWIESVQREVRHVGLELYAGGGSTEIADAVALEVQLLMNVPIDDSTHATVTVNYRQEGVLIVQTDVAHPARAARHWIVMQAHHRVLPLSRRAHELLFQPGQFSIREVAMHLSGYCGVQRDDPPIAHRDR